MSVSTGATATAIATTAQQRKAMRERMEKKMTPIKRPEQKSLSTIQRATRSLSTGTV